MLICSEARNVNLLPKFPVVSLGFYPEFGCGSKQLGNLLVTCFCADRFLFPKASSLNMIAGPHAHAQVTIRVRPGAKHAKGVHL